MNASVMSSHTQKPKSVLNKISTQMNYKLSHKWGSSSKHMWTVQVKSMKKVSNKAPASPYFLVSQCLFIPAVVAESKFESEGKSVCTARKGVRAALSCEYLFPWEAFPRPKPHRIHLHSRRAAPHISQIVQMGMHRGCKLKRKALENPLHSTMACISFVIRRQ